MKEFFSNLMSKFVALSQVQKVIAVAAGLATVAAIGGGAVLLSSASTGGKDIETQKPETQTQLQSQNTETEITEETETQESMTLVMKTTSIEKDLKVKFQGADESLLEGYEFVILVAKTNETLEEIDPATFEGKEYKDEDQDGIIHIKELEGGEYAVLLQEMEGFVVEENPIKATVKDKIAYEEVEIKDEVKDESQINVSKEDTSGNDVVVEEVVKDTLKLIESDSTAEEVGKDKVDYSSFPQVSTGNNITEVLEKVEVTADTGSPEGGNTETETETQTETESQNETESQSETETPSEIESQSIGSSKSRARNPIASATVSLTESLNLYTYHDNQKKGTVHLEITDASGIIQSIEWKEMDEKNAVDVVISDDKKTLTFTAKAAGTATFTATITYDAEVEGGNITTATKTYSCKVLVDDFTGSDTQLKDVDGNLLYLDEEGQTKATAANFATATKLYKEPKYTGWWTLDGYLYYFDENGNKATGQHTIGGVFYDFHEDGTLKQDDKMTGIDVSKHQGKIDWAAVKKAGVEFAIIRCGYRGSSTGVIVEDPTFKANIQGATANGIKVGVYFFTQAVSEYEAVEEASAALALVSGYKLHFPIYIDTEAAGGGNGRADGLDKATRTAVVKAFCETIRNAGYKPGIYASAYWYNNNLNTSQLSTYNIWVAQYRSECTYTGRYDMWQYTNKGSISGIGGAVDMNICYTKY